MKAGRSSEDEQGRKEVKPMKQKWLKIGRKYRWSRREERVVNC